MIGLDSNVLLRYLIKDDPEQARKATLFIRSTVQQGELLYLNQIVLCESVWVLESGYGYTKSEILDVLEKILLTKQFAFQNKDDIWAAYSQFRSSKADFSDLLIGRINLTSGCQYTATFDRGVKEISDFQLL